MKQSTFVLFLLILFVHLATGQDIIHKNNGEEIQAKVLEIGSEEIKYKAFNQPDGPTYVIETARLNKIVYETGKVDTFQDNFTNPELYTHQKRSAIKTGFLSPLFGHLNFTYERNLKPGRSFETKLGFIGVGKQRDGNANGLYLTGAYKFYRTPDYYLKGMRYAHLLKGAYVKPELNFGRYSETVTEGINAQQVKRNITFGALMLNFGKQWVFSDVFLVDFSAGLGYAFDNVDHSDDFSDLANYHFAFAKAGEDTDFAFSMNLNIGFLF